jgi:CDP-paratose 2-epimerase
MVSLYLNAAIKIDSIQGEAFNIGGGMINSFSLIELFSFLESELDIKMKFTNLPRRESDQKIFVADCTKVRNQIGWKPEVTKENGVRKMFDWIYNS